MKKEIKGSAYLKLNREALLQAYAHLQRPPSRDDPLPPISPIQRPPSSEPPPSSPKP